MSVYKVCMYDVGLLLCQRSLRRRGSDKVTQHIPQLEYICKQTLAAYPLQSVQGVLPS